MPVDVTSPHCGCGCRPQGCQPGCPCKECQPGPGIDHLRKHSIRSRHYTRRITELVTKTELTAAEADELDGLLGRLTTP